MEILKCVLKYYYHPHKPPKVFRLKFAYNDNDERL